MIEQVFRVSSIAANDSFTAYLNYTRGDSANHKGTVLVTPVRGVIGICSRELEPKDWSPKGLWSNGFKPLLEFSDCDTITLCFAGAYVTIENILKPGHVGIFTKIRRFKTPPLGVYSALRS